MAEAPLKVIRTALQSYADRGVFRGFSEVKTVRRQQAFRFVWLAPSHMDFCVDQERRILRFAQLLPNIPARSSLYQSLRAFIDGRHDAALPEHRRIDRKWAVASCSNRAGTVSISLKISSNQYAYGVNKIVNLVHELFILLRESYPEYLTENFDVPQD